MVSDFAPGNYRFIPAVFQYSSGVAASPGFEVARIRFDKLLPLAEGFARIASYIQAAGRPLTSFCACELRSPAAFTEEGFRAFNQHYVKTLAEWGLFDGTTNPVARSNVCPEIDPPTAPSFYAFSFTRPSTATSPSFVIAGSGESQEGAGSYAERTVRYRDLSAEGLAEKVRTRLQDDCLGNLFKDGSFDFHGPTGRVTAHRGTGALSSVCAEPFLQRFARDPDPV